MPSDYNHCGDCDKIVSLNTFDNCLCHSRLICKKCRDLHKFTEDQVRKPLYTRTNGKPPERKGFWYKLIRQPKELGRIGPPTTMGSMFLYYSGPPPVVTLICSICGPLPNVSYEGGEAAQDAGYHSRDHHKDLDKDNWPCYRTERTWTDLIEYDKSQGRDSYEP
jgi:hypothetical protein